MGLLRVMKRTFGNRVLQNRAATIGKAVDIDL